MRKLLLIPIIPIILLWLIVITTAYILEWITLALIISADKIESLIKNINLKK